MPEPLILIVDDEADIRELISDILADEGYRVQTAANASEADAAYRDMQPDLVLLDIWMPDSDGITLLEQWQKQSPLCCPVVMMSGHGNVETAVQATRLGALDFIEKPVALNKLLAMTERALAHDQPSSKVMLVEQTLPYALPSGNSDYRQALRQQLQSLAGHLHHYALAGEPGTCARDLVHWVHENSPLASLPLLFDQRALQALTAGQIARGSICISAVSLLKHEQQQLLHDWASAAEPDQPRRLVLCSSGEVDDLNLQGTLTASLYELLDGTVVVLQPLRHHLIDVPVLLRQYSEMLSDRDNLPYRSFSLAAQNQLRQFAWPGNECQLRRFVRQLLLLGGKQEISAAEVQQQLQLLQQQPAVAGMDNDIFNLPLRQAREAFERHYLTHHLQQTDGNVGALADKVGMERTHLYRKLRGLGLDPRQISKPAESLINTD
ncbi:MAG: response regulator [Gammaproteobacteria bacterium]|jgi:two-component system nitrogen regulation response regulator NtrX|nr:response regulator [Gammaproteobacteria bacterium]